MKEFPKSMDDALLDLKLVQTTDAKGRITSIKGASTYTMFLDDNDNLFVKLYFDADLMDRSFGFLKMASNEKKEIFIFAKSGLNMNFFANAIRIGRNFVTLKVTIKNIEEYLEEI